VWQAQVRSGGCGGGGGDCDDYDILTQDFIIDRGNCNM